MKKYRLKIPVLTPSNLAAMVVLLNNIEERKEPLSQVQRETIELQFNEPIPNHWLEGIEEPKVLEAEEIADSEFNFGEYKTFTMHRADIINLIKIGDKNGQLRYKRLRQWAENNVSPENSLFKILAEIKPL